MKIKEKLSKKDFIKTNISVIVPIIIILCILIFGFVKNWLKKDAFIGYFEIVIEAIFLLFVVKEFKMTRKSFEWQQKEQQEKKDKEANRQLNEIIRCFFIYYYNFWVGNYRKMSSLEEYGKYRKWTEEENEKYNQCYWPDENKRLNYLINEYKKKSNGEIIIIDDKEEEEIIKKIIEKCVIYVFEIQGFAGETVFHRNKKEEKQNLLEFNEFINNYVIKPELVKILNIDYKILEKIYHHCLYGKYCN